jgi:hypothetical protein
MTIAIKILDTSLRGMSFYYAVNHNMNCSLLQIYLHKVHICFWFTCTVACICLQTMICFADDLVSITYCGYTVAVVVSIAGSVIAEQESMFELTLSVSYAWLS